MKKKLSFLSIAISLILGLSVMPQPVFASNVGVGTGSNTETEVTLTVDASVLTNNIDSLPTELAETVELLPDSGLLVENAPLVLADGATAYDLIVAYLDANEIPYDIPDTEWGPFVSSISGIAGGDAGDMSWWNFNVNGEMAMEGVGTYVAQPGDSIELVYTADLAAPVEDEASLTIDFTSLTQNIDLLPAELAAVVKTLPENGLLVENTPLAFDSELETTAYDLIVAYLDANEIPFDIPNTEWGRFINSISGIAGGAAGDMSWWNFNVNGEMAMEGVGTYIVQPGDSIELVYYAELGAPVLAEANLTIDLSVLTESIDLLSDELAAIVETLPESGLLVDSAPLTLDLSTDTTAYELIVAYLDANEIPYDMPVHEEFGPFINSINGVAGGAAGDMSWWNFNVNGEMASVGVGSYVVQAGDSIELVYTADLSTDEDTDTNDDLEEIEIVDSFWPNHRGNSQNNGLRDLAEFTPVQGLEVDLVWADAFASAGTAPSQGIIVNNEFVFVANSTLYAVNPSTGGVIRTLELPGDLGYASTSPLYAEGRIFIPLNNSRLVSFPYANWTAGTSLEDIAGSWSFKDDTNLQVQTSLSYSDGKVILPLLNVNRTANSPLIALDAVTGEVNWKLELPGGFYNTTGVIDGNRYISGTEPGQVIVVDINSGTLLSSTELGTQVRSPLVKVNSYFFLTVNTGGGSKFVKFTVDGSGAVNLVFETDLADLSSSAAVISGNRAYVATQGRSFYVIDINSGAVIREISYESDFQGVTASPLLVRDGETVHVYFTVNDDSGNIWYFTDNSSMTEDAVAEVIFQIPAELRDYSRNSMLMNADGSIFLGLDNGNYLAIRSAGSAEPTEPTSEVTNTTQTSTATTTATEGSSSEPITATGESSTGFLLIIISMSLATILIVSRVYIKKKSEE